jgi:hypothetical protein
MPWLAGYGTAIFLTGIRTRQEALAVSRKGFQRVLRRTQHGFVCRALVRWNALCRLMHWMRKVTQ